MSELLKALNQNLAALAVEARRSLVRIENGRRGGGAGVILHAEGLILTNAHVLRARSTRVRLPQGESLTAQVLAKDSKYDLAALAVEARDLPAAHLGDSEELRAGHWVVAVGHPWGVEGAATAGVVIDVGVPLEMARLGKDLIQVSLQLRPGHSGGALVGQGGLLVGVNTMMAGPNVGLAVPMHVAKTFLRESLGSASRLSLG